MTEQPDLAASGRVIPTPNSTIEWATYQLLQRAYLLLEQMSHSMQQLMAVTAAEYRHMEVQMSALDDNITKLQSDVTNLTSVDESAIALLNGIQAQIAAATQAALAAGATSDQLSALSALDQALQAQTSALAAAVAANTPAPPPPPAPTP